MKGYILAKICSISIEVLLFQKMHERRQIFTFEIIENLKLREDVSKTVYVRRQFKLYPYVYIILTYFVSKNYSEA